MSDDLNVHSLFVHPLRQDHRQGELSAPVVLVMYGDYQCVLSANVYRLIKVTQRQLGDLFGDNYLCVIFRHFPQIHSNARHAAEAAEAAAVQGQFWQMHDLLFTHQRLENGYLVEYANNLGLNISRFLQDLSQRVHIDRINRDIDSGNQSGITSAPVLFINGIRYRDRWSVEHLMAAINAAG